MKNDTEINIDILLRDTWLTVVELRQGTPVRRGLALYHHCQQQVEQVCQTLLNAGFSQQDTEHITYAQCALLDETVLSREDPDDGQKVWLETPLQAHFFNTLQAGELLYERIRQVLHEPAPVPAVLTCFHRVLLLGFRGRYQEPLSADREKLVAMLSERVAPFRVSPEAALLNAVRPARKSRLWYSPLFWLSVAVILLVGAWWGLDSWLEALQTLMVRHWADFWPMQAHSRVTLLSWLAEKLQQSLRTMETPYHDLVRIYRCEQYLADIEKVLQQRELWHLTRMDIVAGQLRNVALRLERHTPQGMEINVTPINALTTTSIAPENVVQLAIQPERQAAATAPRRSWPMFFAGMMTAACLSGIGIGGWIFFNQPDLREQERNALPISELSHYAQAQRQLLHLSQQLDTLDERKGKYMTASELKSAVFAVRQSLQTPPLEELLRQLDEQTRAGEVAPALIVQIETRFQQLLNRYALLSNPRVNHSEQEKTP